MTKIQAIKIIMFICRSSQKCDGEIADAVIALAKSVGLKAAEIPQDIFLKIGATPSTFLECENLSFDVFYLESRMRWIARLRDKNTRVAEKTLSAKTREGAISKMEKYIQFHPSNNKRDVRLGLISDVPICLNSLNGTIPVVPVAQEEYGRTKWLPEHIALLPNFSTSVIARVMEVSRKAVENKRNALGIPHPRLMTTCNNPICGKRTPRFARYAFRNRELFCSVSCARLSYQNKNAKLLAIGRLLEDQKAFSDSKELQHAS